VKLSGNFLITAVIESLSEAIALVRKYGIDPHDYVDFLTSTLFAAPIYKTYGGLIADAQHEKVGFALRLGLKDIRLALAAAESVDAPLPVASLVRDHMLTAIARGFDKQDWSVLGRLAAENAGLR
jgi:3-hydroxyisobutyrate dehydrogenase-like beta-hydroxyacid dehydrogenase